MARRQGSGRDGWGYRDAAGRESGAGKWDVVGVLDRTAIVTAEWERGGLCFVR